MLRRPTLLVAAASLAFLLGLVWQAPADLLGRASAALGWQLIDPSGRLWAGRAAALRGGPLALQDLRWELQPLALLRGRLALALEAGLPGGFLRGRVAIGRDRLAFRDLEAAVPLALAGPWVGMPVAEGDASLRFDYLLLIDGWPRAAVGELRLAGVPLGLPGSAGDAGHGDFRLSFSQAEPAERLSAELRDFGGDLELSGQLQLEAPNRYLLSGRVRARAQAPDSLRQGLALVGPADRDGRHEFSFSGSL
ncbi:MAG: type II secretion system protein N [Gammaproteobacteria bacterium]|nr:MAG: type II secretion system protein N [Gammaproteobacteria bacterium]